MNSTKEILISVVSPVFGCRDSLTELYSRLKTSLEKISPHFEIILVDDSGPDQPWDVIREICLKDPRVKGIQLSRNFGQHYAIAAGLEYASGRWIIVLDCDLQDKPEEIPQLYNKAQEGFDIVLGKRVVKKDNPLKRLFSRLFYSLLSFLTDTKQDSSIANFGIYHREVIRAVKSMKDSSRYFPAMIQWVGFRQTNIPVEHEQRKKGKTSYTFRRLLNLSMDVIFSFSDKPLRLTIKLGIFISSLSFVFAICMLVLYLKGQIIISGWTSLIISIWLLSGIIIMLIGMIGLYIGKTYENSKNRPNFIISQTQNLTNQKDV